MATRSLTDDIQKYIALGLMGHVLSVEKTGGFIKVVTTEAEIEDCYEEFDLDAIPRSSPKSIRSSKAKMISIQSSRFP